ncbi:hypothetical protein DPM19_18365 [Actinomadura craniellae]|uniref:ARB-07466-like C-terminal domain-containing protein n=1 Tax=Actinomadura craniellae TaxID=2231787 RepID=A0A365H3Z5_9ACTN|nr:hypothetical protein DPM19_18365 [Actinomadura craniellae]
MLCRVVPRWRPRRTGLALASAIGALTMFTGSTAGAAPAAAAPGDIAKVNRLTKQIQQLERQYRGELEELRDTRNDAKRALQKADALRDDLAAARGVVAQLAAARYISNGIEPSVAILATDDPSTMLSGATMADHLSQNHAAKVQQIQALVTAQEKAQQEAGARIDKLEKAIKDLNAQKARVQQLLKKYKPESPSIGMGGITPRMARVKAEIDTEFGPFPIIGCMRAGDPGEHGKGRACDFMESTAGSMPSSARMAHGDQVSNYLIRNGSRMGVMYIIWRQRIYDFRTGAGWKMMGDRGSITQNHYDHVHVSVF